MQAAQDANGPSVRTQPGPAELLWMQPPLAPQVPPVKKFQLLGAFGVVVVGAAVVVVVVVGVPVVVVAVHGVSALQLQQSSDLPAGAWHCVPPVQLGNCKHHVLPQPVQTQ